MSLAKTIDGDIKSAMLQKKKEDLTALRGIKAAILLAQTESGATKELSGDDEIKLLSKMAKQRKDSAEIYTTQNRADLAEKELQELEVINRYLPKQLSTEDVEAEVRSIIADTGAESMKDMGKVMGIASKKLAGMTDGKTISAIVKKLLG
ncbi:MAG: GatB/YqeY domain-containing protein [Cyclobacteriaceae bacterium]|nr:GatB/YqeY domain-containing protein [Cyclobacteriaceae bacterium]